MKLPCAGWLCSYCTCWAPAGHYLLLYDAILSNWGLQARKYLEAAASPGCSKGSSDNNCEINSSIPFSDHLDNYAWTAWPEVGKELVKLTLYTVITYSKRISHDCGGGDGCVCWFFFFLINKTTPKRALPLLFCTVLTFLNWQVKGHASGEKTADF